jgi:hypothetical protein
MSAHLREVALNGESPVKSPTVLPTGMTVLVVD